MSGLLPRSPPYSKQSALYVAHQSFILMLPNPNLGGELSKKTKGDYGITLHELKQELTSCPSQCVGVHSLRTDISFSMQYNVAMVMLLW